MDILDTTSHANAIITDLVKIAEKKGAAEGSTPKTIAADINLITNTLSGNEEAKSPVIVRALDELVNAVDSGSGGGETWNTVFEGSVTTEALQGIGVSVGDIEGFGTTADSIKVTFNGVEYLCEKNANGGYGATNTGDAYDWSEYPFEISSDSLFTPTAGTYSLKIEEPQSGGESDFSTAEVTVNANRQFEFYAPLINDEHGYLGSYNNINPSESVTLTVGLYKGKALAQFITDGVVSVSGNAQLNDDQILITGNCTITIS